MNQKKILGFALGPIASAFFGLVTLPLMAWMFSPEDIGRINLFQVTLSFSLLLLMLGLDIAYVREYHGSKDQPALLKACFAPGFVLLLVCALGSIGFGRELAYWLFSVPDPNLYALTLLCVVVNYISRFLSLILRMQERGLAFSMSQVIPKALQLVLLGVVVWLGLQRSFLTLLWISVASMLTVVLVYLWNTRAQWRPAVRARVSATQTRSLLKFGFPLVFSGLAYWGLTATSTVVLRSQSNLGELGTYSVTNSFSGVAAIFQSIFTVMWGPTVFKWVNEGVDMTRVDAIARQALTVVCATFALVGSCSWLTDFVLPAHYINVKYLVVCAITPPLLYTLSEITGIGITITRRTMFLVWVTLAALATNVVLSLWLVPAHGAAGAVMANAVAYVVFFVARTEASARVWRQFPRARLYVFVGLAVAFSLATVALAPALPFHYALVWLALLPVVAWCFQAELLDMVAFGRHAWHNRRAV